MDVDKSRNASEIIVQLATLIKRVGRIGGISAPLVLDEVYSVVVGKHMSDNIFNQIYIDIEGRDAY